MDETNKSTIINVRLIRSDLKKIDDAAIQLAIDDAWVIVKHEGFVFDMQEQACRYLAASMLKKQGERVSLEQVCDLKRQYFKGNANPWYTRYLDLLSRFSKGGGTRLTVIG